jgi:hypothetical protein
MGFVDYLRIANTQRESRMTNEGLLEGDSHEEAIDRPHRSSRCTLAVRL